MRWACRINWATPAESTRSIRLASSVVMAVGSVRRLSATALACSSVHAPDSTILEGSPGAGFQLGGEGVDSLMRMFRRRAYPEAARLRASPLGIEPAAAAP